MENKNKKSRLLKLARHLGNKHLKEILSNQKKEYAAVKGDCNIEHFHWAIEEFPMIYADWQYGNSNIPFLKDHRQFNSLTAAALYLSLDMDELFHLLVPEYQMKFYNGHVLNILASPSELASNIYEFLRYMQDEEDADALQNQITQDKQLTIPKIISHERNEIGMSKMCA